MADTIVFHGEHEDADRSDRVGTIDFGRLFSVLRNRFLLICAVTALFCAASVIFSLLLKNYYVSTTSILVDPEGSRIVEGEIDSGARATEARALNQQYILTSVKVLAAVVKSEGLADDPEFGAGEPYEADAGKRTQRALVTLQNAISAEINKSSFVIDLSAQTHDPVKSARIANAIANTYIQTRLEMNTGVLRQATTDLSSQLESLEKAVEDGDRAVQAYKAEHNLIDVAGRPTAEQQIAETNTEITRISASIAENEALISELALARSNPDYLRSTPDASLTPAIIELRTRYHTALEQQSVLQSQFGDRHPLLQSAKARTRAVSSLLDKQLKDFTTSLARNGDKLKSQLGLLRKNLATFRASLNESDQSMVRLRELERKLASDRAVYESFLLRTRQLSGQERTVSENPQVISVAQVPLTKAGPRRSLIVAGATLLGLLFGCGAALVMDRKTLERGPEIDDDGARTPVITARREPGRRLFGWLHRRKASETQNAEEGDVEGRSPVRQDLPAYGPPRLSRVALSGQKAEGSYTDIAQDLIARAEGRRNYCLTLYSASTRQNAYRNVLQLARALAQAKKKVLLVDADTDAGLTRHAYAAGLPGLLDAMALHRIKGEFVKLPASLGIWLLPLGRRSPRISTHRNVESGSLTDWLHDNQSTFDLIIVHAGRVDQARPIPAVEAASACFAVLGSRLDPQETEEAVSHLDRQGLSPLVAFLVEREQGSFARVG